MFIICLFISFFMISTKISHFIFPSREEIKLNMKSYDKIQFKGKVLNIIPVERGGRIYGIMCIKLDYSNVSKFYRFDRIHCLKIENGIATLPTGALGNKEDDRVKGILNSVYIEVNLKGKGKMNFYDKNGKIMIGDLYYRNNNLKEKDMEACGGM